MIDSWYDVLVSGKARKGRSMAQKKEPRRTAVINNRWKLEAVKACLSERQVLYDFPPVTKDSEAIDRAFDFVLGYFRSEMWTKDKAAILELKRQMDEAKARQDDLQVRMQEWKEQRRLRADWESLPPEEQERRRKQLASMTPEERKQQQEEWNSASPEKREKMIEAAKKDTRRRFKGG